jgi:hypothetical protein
MSKRTSIVTALVNKLRTIDGTGTFNTNIYGAAFGTLKFWDEVDNFPCVYLIAGTETREYHPSDFTWAYLNLALRVYTKGENASDQLEDVLEDIEQVINSNRQLVYDDLGNSTTEILVTSIVTDEGLLAPYAIAEVNLQIRYQKLQ